jgi:8-oxo-dGTP diphosphatase
VRDVTDRHPRHVVAVTAVVFDAAGRVLLVKGDCRGWEPPGGQVELGEDLLTALEREVREEARVEIEVGNILSVNSNLGRPEEDVPEMVVLAFSCRHLSGEPRAEEECSDAGWFAPEKVPQQRDKLHDALGGERGLRYRAYRTRPYETLLDEGLGGIP